MSHIFLPPSQSNINPVIMAPSDHRPDCSCGSLDDSPDSQDTGFPVIVEHREEGECLETSRMLEMRRTAASGDCHDVHRRNLTSVASPVILMFDGFHNLVYHIYLATRWGSGISSLCD